MCTVRPSESERQRGRTGESDSELDFSRERATVHTRESKRAKFKTTRDFFRFTVLRNQCWGVTRYKSNALLLLESNCN